jgi:serine protease Do
MTSPATTLTFEGAELAWRLSQGLVSIRSGAGGGAGTAWTTDGLIVTNHHVAPGDRVEVTLPDDSGREGRVIARDEANDLALIRVDAELTPLEHGDSRSLRPGNLVFAIGNPWGQRGTLTRGVVLTRGAGGLETDAPVRDVIRADIRLAPGNSGGPLADAAGRVIGINAMIVGGMGVAIPVHTAEAFIDSHEEAEPGVLGVTLMPVAIPGAMAAAFALTPEALMLTGIEPGSPADSAGLLPGDLLVGVAGAGGGVRSIAGRLRRIHAGRPVELSILRGGSLVTTRATPVVRT